MALDELLKVLSDDDYLEVRIDGSFFLEEQGSRRDIKEAIDELDGDITAMEVTDLKKGDGVVDFLIEAVSFL